jgi:hypothetical protein
MRSAARGYLGVTGTGLYDARGCGFAGGTGKGVRQALGAQGIEAEIPQPPQGGEDLERKARFFA